MEIKSNLNAKLSEVDIKNVKLFSKVYVDHLISLLEKIDHNLIEKTINLLEKARNNNQKIFIIGNGGSAATASHIGNDFGLVFSKAKKLDREKPYRVNSLVDNNSLLTAIGNDYGYEEVFLEQLKINFEKGDIILSISASGNSSNLIKCVEWGRANGAKIISWLGFDGGKLLELSDITLHVQTANGEYAPVEDIHLIFNHIIVTWMQFYAKGL